MKKLLSLVLICLLALASMSALAELDESNPVVISMCGAITGSYSDYGLGYRAATQVQVDKWNANGGIDGRKIVVKEYDEKGEIEEGVAIAQKVVVDETSTRWGYARPLPGTPAPEVVTPSVPLKSAGEITVYYFDVSKGYHVAPDCKGMNGAPAHTLADAAADGKRACGNCKPASTSLIGQAALWQDENGVCHTSDECASFSGAYRLVLRDDALAQGLAACPDCGAAEYLIPGTVLAGN